MDATETILQKLPNVTPAEVAELVPLAARLPGPSEFPPDRTVQVLYELAQKSEGLDDPNVSLELFRRVLSYSVQNRQIHAGTWFRIAVVEQRNAEFDAAIAAYRKALSYPEAWPEMAGLARFNLADMLATTEEFGEAIGLLRDVQARFLPNPYIDEKQVAVSLARCLLMEGRPDEALAAVSAYTNDADSEWSAKVHALQAEIYESKGDTAGSRAAYTRIFNNPFAKQELRAASAYRIAALR